MREVRAALLAGGRGERMGRLGERSGKPLVPYAASCRLVDFSIANAARSGIGEVVLMSGDRERELVDHVLRWWDDRPGFHVHLGPNEPARAYRGPGGGLAAGAPLADRPAELGTADALLSNAEHVFAAPVTDVLVQHADHVYIHDYAAMLAAHRAAGADVTIGVQPIERRFVRLFGMVDVDPAGWVRRLVEKPAEPTSELIFTAFALFRAGPLAEVLAELAAGPVEGWQHDISRDVLPRMIEAGLRVRAFRVEGYWADIGTVERYHLGHLALLADPGMLPAGLLPRTLAAAAPVYFPAGNLVGAGVTVGGEVRRSVLGPGCVVEPGAVVERSVLLPGAQVPAGVRVIDTVVVEGETLSADRVGLAELEVPAGPVPGPERKG